MNESTIKRETERGFGFIRTHRGNDLFFHMSAVGGTTLGLLREGRRVTNGDKGARAKKVRPL
jgi:cold shock CspA family protein